MWNYSEFGDGRIVEDGESLVLFKEKSKYQEVVILQTNEFGPTLILDGNESTSMKHLEISFIINKDFYSNIGLDSLHVITSDIEKKI